MRKHDRSEERTVFQEASPYYPKTDSRADVATVYGLNDTFEERVARSHISSPIWVIGLTEARSRDIG